jgi:hypothetical protein
MDLREEILENHGTANQDDLYMARIQTTDYWESHICSIRDCSM